MKISTTIVMDPSPVAFKYLEPTVVAGCVDEEQSQMNSLTRASLQEINTAGILWRGNIKNCHVILNIRKPYSKLGKSLFSSNENSLFYEYSKCELLAF